MREFSKVSPKLWRSKRFRGLDSDDARLLYVYLLSCEHQTSAGCFRLPAAYAAADLGWTDDHFQAGMKVLAGADLIVRDTETEEVFVRRWFNHNPPTNGNHLKGARRLISEVDSDSVREVAEEELEQQQASRKEPIDEGNPGSHLTKKWRNG